MDARRELAIQAAEKVIKSCSNEVQHYLAIQALESRALGGMIYNRDPDEACRSWIAKIKMHLEEKKHHL